MTARLDFKSVRFRTWIYFVLMSVVLLGVLWGAMILFFNFYYQSMSKREIKRNGDNLTAKFGTDGFLTSAKDAAVLNGLSVYVFYFDENGDRVPVCYANSIGATDVKKADESLLNALLDDRDGKFYENGADRRAEPFATAIANKGNYIVYGSYRDDATTESFVGAPVWTCLIKPLVPFDSSAAVLRNQFVIVSIICLFVALLLSFVLSSHISKPLSDFSKVAEKLGKGDYGVRFVGNGYTEIEELASTLNYATEEMGKTEALRRDFLANVSHDLRTPLTMVKAYAEMIRDISGSDEIKRTEHAQVIIEEADRLAELVGDILNLSKIQSGTDKPDPELMDLSEITAEVISRFGIKCEKEGYVFKTEIDDGVRAYGDVKRIEQVLYNLIGNALNYTGSDKTVSVKVFSEGGKARFEVTDTGKGIPPEEIDTIWDRYYRSNINKRSHIGTGLGLSIVKSILLSHNAEFGIESEVGKGSTFWFALESSGPAAEEIRARKKK